MNTKPQRTIRSYVLRQGRMTDAQKHAFTTLLDKYSIVLTEEKICFKEVFNNTNEVILEIGFGMGQSLVQMAIENPDKNYLGIEVHQPGVGRLMHELEEKSITNVRVLNKDAVQVLNEHVSDDTLAGVQIFFPDPWPKKKHHKRRIIQVEFVNHIITKLKKEGFIHVATDWAPYAEHIIEVLNQIPELKNGEGSKLHSHLIKNRPDTRFENRGLKLGHDICDVVYIKP